MWLRIGVIAPAPLAELVAETLQDAFTFKGRREGTSSRKMSYKLEIGGHSEPDGRGSKSGRDSTPRLYYITVATHLLPHLHFNASLKYNLGQS